MSKVCHFCGNKHFKHTTVQYTYRHDDKFLFVNDVPCEQCEYCGEQYFKASVLKTIETEFNAIHSHGKKIKTEIRVPVEPFLDLIHA
ncbi:MAG: YgiT-type zinc finger protein [Pseudomonadota bacterium]